MSLHVDIEHERVAEFCRRNPIQRLAFFGSVLRSDFGPQSDVDVLVEFAPRAQVTLLNMVRMEDELSEIIGRSDDSAFIQSNSWGSKSLSRTSVRPRVACPSARWTACRR